MKHDVAGLFADHLAITAIINNVISLITVKVSTHIVVAS
jgi:hypothetical protein